MKIGYNTNGLACHRWDDALRLIASKGYQSVAITVDHHCLDPFSPRFSDELRQMRSLLDELELSSVIETGARFLLDPKQKHEPTLLTADASLRQKRVRFLCQCVDIARELESTAVSFWSGILRDTCSDEESLGRLVDGCREVAEYAQKQGQQLAFEPEPGMLIETMEQFDRLDEQVDHPSFQLTIDLGHVQCVEEASISSVLEQYRSRIINIHIEDMCRGVHEHLRFGEGEIDFDSVFTTLKEIQYEGPLNVELSRHSHMAPEVVAESMQFIRSFFEKS